MKGVDAAKSPCSRRAETPPAKRPRKAEETSFDLALEQALAVPSGASPSAAATARAQTGAGGSDPPPAGGRPQAETAGAAGQEPQGSAPRADSPLESSRGGRSAGSDEISTSDMPADTGDSLAGSDAPPTDDATIRAQRIDSISMRSRFESARGDATGGQGHLRVEASDAATATAGRVESARPGARGAAAAEANEAAEADGASAPHEPSAQKPEAPQSGGADRITVRFDGEGGVDGLVQMAVLGRSIHARIVSSDAESAKRMREDSDSLRRSLADAGFRDARITIRRARGASGDAALREGRIQ